MKAESSPTRSEGWTRQSIGVLVLCFLAWAFESYELTTLSIATPAIMADLNLSRADVGVLYTILGWIFRISAFMLIPLADVIGRRLMVALVVLGYSLFTGLTGLSQSLLQLTLFSSLTRILLSSASLTPSALLTLGAVEEERISPNQVAQR